MALRTPPAGDASSERPWVVVIAASAGGVAALGRSVAEPPADFPGVDHLTIQHRMATQSKPSESESLGPPDPAARADREGWRTFLPGVVNIARPDMHLTVTPDHRFEYVDGPRYGGPLIREPAARINLCCFSTIG